MKRNNTDKVFMSYRGKRIWYRIIDGEIIYMVAKGDGTDEYFNDLDDVYEWIEEHI